MTSRVGWVLSLAVLAATPPLLSAPAGDLELEGMDPEARRQMEEARVEVERLEREEAPATVRAEAWGELGRLGILYSLATTAEEALTRAAALAPDDWSTLHLLGVVQSGGGRLEAAAASFRRVLALEPTAGATAVRLGRVELELARPEEAEQAFTLALADPGLAAAARHGLGRAALAAGRPEEAVGHLERALELAPQADVLHYPLALAYRALGRLDDAREHLSRRGETEPPLADPVLDELGAAARGAAAHLFRGNRLRRAGDHQAALEEYRRAAALAGDDPEAHLRLGAALEESEDPGAAVAAFERAAELAPRDPRPLLRLGLLQARLGQLDVAERSLARAVELTPERRDALYNLGSVQLRSGRLTAAEATFRRLVEMAPEDAGGRLGLGRVLLQTGRLPAAEAELRTAVAAGLEGAAVFLGRALAQQGRLIEAAAAYAMAAKAADAPPEMREEAFFGGSLALLLAEHEREARVTLEEAVGAFADSLRLRHLLARVLAAAGDPAVRDGERALALARAVLESEPSAEHAATVAMALAEQGRFDEAAEIEQRVMAASQASGATWLTAEARRRLESYRRQQPIRVPWRIAGEQPAPEGR